MPCVITAPLRYRFSSSLPGPLNIGHSVRLLVTELNRISVHDRRFPPLQLFPRLGRRSRVAAQHRVGRGVRVASPCSLPGSPSAGVVSPQTVTSQSLPGSLSLPGYQRRSRRCAPCPAHPKKRARGVPGLSRSFWTRRSAASRQLFDSRFHVGQPLVCGVLQLRNLLPHLTRLVEVLNGSLELALRPL